MPTTEAGKRLLDEWDATTEAADREWAIRAIEANAAGEAYAESVEACGRAIAAERARIREAVEGLNPQQDGDIVTLNGTHRRPVTPADYVELYRAAILAIIDADA